MNSIKHSEMAPGDIVQPTGGMDGRMTRDDIQRMALDAGFTPKELSRAMTDRLERFISLVDKETTSLCWAGALQVDQQPYAWVVPPSNHIFRGEHAEHDAKREASHCGGTTRAVPLYTLLAVAEQLRGSSALWSWNNAPLAYLEEKLNAAIEAAKEMK